MAELQLVHLVNKYFAWLMNVPEDLQVAQVARHVLPKPWLTASKLQAHLCRTTFRLGRY